MSVDFCLLAGLSGAYSDAGRGILCLYVTHAISAGTHSLNKVKMKKNTFFFTILGKIQGFIPGLEINCPTPNSRYLQPVFGEYYYQQKVLYSMLRSHYYSRE